MFHLHTLGRVDLVGPDGREVTPILAQPKRLALLVYLALANSTSFRRRDTVLSLLWPDYDAEHARASLRQSLSYLRRSLGDGVVLTRGEEEIGVDASLLWCDAAAFDAACDRLPEEAVALYHGPFLPGLFVEAAAPEFDIWIEDERLRRRRAAGRQARLVAEHACVRGDLLAALGFAREEVRLVPEEEGAVARLIGLLDRMGDRAGALSEYESFCRRLGDEHGAEPAPETKALIGAVRSRTQPVHAASNSPTDFVPPPVGRLPARAAGYSWRLATAGLLAFVAVSVLALHRRARLDPPEGIPPLDPNLVAVAPFDVFQAEHALWHEGLTDLLSALLDGAGPLRSVPAGRVIHVWAGNANRESAAALGRETGAGIVVYGRMLGSGPDTIRVMATVLDLAASGAVDLEVRDRADRMDRVGDSLALRVLRELGRTRPIAAVRGGSLGSSSLPALKAFLAGEQLYRRNRADSALPHFERAVGLDSSFALGWRRMMGALTILRPETDSVVRAYGLRAGSLNHGLAPRESLLVTADSLYQAVTMQVGDPDLAAHTGRLHATLEEVTRRYPEDAEAWFLLGRARLYFPPMGLALELTLAAIDRAIALDSSFLPAMVGPPAAEIALRLGREEAARRHLLAQASAAFNPAETDGYRFAALMLANAQRGYDVLEQWADTAGIESVVAAVDALALWPDSGEAAVRLVRALLRRIRSADSVDQCRRCPPSWSLSSAWALALRGHLREATSVYPRAAGLVSFFGGMPRESVAVVLSRHGASVAGLPWWVARRDTVALRGQRARFDSLARWASETPESQNRVRGASPVFARRLAWYDRARTDAYLTLARGDTAEAIAQFVPLIDSLCVGCSWTRLFTDIYFAAPLLHARGRGVEAERWLEYDAITVPYPVYDVAMELVLGRVAESLGKRDKAVGAYRRVSLMWARADRELEPMVAEARAALLRLGVVR